MQRPAWTYESSNRNDNADDRSFGNCVAGLGGGPAGPHHRGATVSRRAEQAFGQVSVRRNDFTAGLGEFPRALDFGGGRVQRPGRPGRQPPHAQGPGRQVRRTEPLPVGRREQFPGQSRAGQETGAQGHCRRSGDGPGSLRFRDRGPARGADCGAGLGVYRLRPAGGEKEFHLSTTSSTRRDSAGPWAAARFPT